MAEGRRTTRVGRYELGKTIGEGSFAKVKIARDTRDGSTCAIKVLDRNHVLRHKMVEQVLLPSLYPLSLLHPLGES
jgi:serine/threonine protein kinase